MNAKVVANKYFDVKSHYSNNHAHQKVPGNCSDVYYSSFSTVKYFPIDFSTRFIKLLKRSQFWTFLKICMENIN